MTLDHPDEQKRHRDEGHRALGRYIAQFSVMVKEMRDRMTWRLQDPADPPMLAEVVFGEATATQIANAFFGISEMLLKHDDDEKLTAAKLKVLVREAIEFRNDIAHGDWYIGYWATTGLPDGGSAPPVPTPAWFVRFKPGRRKGPLSSKTEDLDTRSEELERLTKLLREYGLVCFGMHGRQIAGQHIRVCDVVLLEDGRPVPGPKAVV